MKSPLPPLVLTQPFPMTRTTENLPTMRTTWEKMQPEKSRSRRCTAELLRDLDAPLHRPRPAAAPPTLAGPPSPPPSRRWASHTAQPSRLGFPLCACFRTRKTSSNCPISFKSDDQRCPIPLRVLIGADRCPPCQQIFFSSPSPGRATGPARGVPLGPASFRSACILFLGNCFVLFITCKL
jgi:hypothetical protein